MRPSAWRFLAQLAITAALSVPAVWIHSVLRSYAVPIAFALLTQITFQVGAWFGRHHGVD